MLGVSTPHEKPPPVGPPQATVAARGRSGLRADSPPVQATAAPVVLGPPLVDTSVLQLASGWWPARPHAGLQPGAGLGGDGRMVGYEEDAEHGVIEVRLGRGLRRTAGRAVASVFA